MFLSLGSEAVHFLLPQKKNPLRGYFFCAVGETRTLMGLLPLAPKASVSTIPPPQHF